MQRHNSRPHTTRSSSRHGQRDTRAGRVSEVCMVLVWAAAIPGLMWLGAAGGF